MKSNLYAVIDTNVLVSALISKTLATPPLVVLAHVYSGDITPVYNDEIIQEYCDVLSREKFHLNPTDIENALQVFLDYGLNLNRTKVDDETISDPKGVVFYEVKMTNEDAFLVTGNTKHFPRKPFVVTPREMVEILEKAV